MTRAIAWEGRILAEEDVRKLPLELTELVIASNVIVTPLAWDWLRQRRILIRKQTQSAAKAEPMGGWIFLEHSGCRSATAVAEAIQRRGITLTRQPLEGSFLAGVIKTARQIAGSADRGCLALGEEAEVACGLANKLPGVRAIAPASVSAMREWLKLLPANLVGLVPGRLTHFEMIQIADLAARFKRPSGETEAEKLFVELNGNAHC